MTTTTKASKVMVLGIDALDPRLCKKYLAEGRMPNLEKFLAKASAMDDLTMLNGIPTVTPPMWTSLATGARPATHGITGFFRIVPGKPHVSGFNMDSTNCHAEQLWNVSAENGLKTLVFHWPGSSWPPSSDSPNLHVVDGTNPGGVNVSVAQVEKEFLVVADSKTTEVLFKSKAVTDSNVPCVVTDLKISENEGSFTENISKLNETELITYEKKDGQYSMTEVAYDAVISPIKEATGWENASSDAKEFIMLFSQGRIRRSCLILKGQDNVYDHVAIYKNKKSTEPIAIIYKDEFKASVIDESFNGEEKCIVNRNMRMLELDPKGNHVKIWVTSAMVCDNDALWHPKRLYQDVVKSVGYPSPECMNGSNDRHMIVDCMIGNWEVMLNWQADTLHYLIEQEKYNVVFSHFHSVDGCGHMIVKFMKQRSQSRLPEEDYQEFFALAYEQADRYIGKFLHFIDEGWTVFLVSDHGQVSPEYDPAPINDSGITIPLMKELGFTVLKRDENGNEIREIDWTKTKAVAQICNIIINLKGREENGIVEPADKYELEEEIMTALYGYRDPKTGKRVIALALRNRDAIALGMGGPECGDIIFFNAEGYTYDHADSLPTTLGYADTSCSAFFAAAGLGIKENYRTQRVISMVDVAPTIAMLMDLPYPAQCEGAPIYQIMN